MSILILALIGTLYYQSKRSEMLSSHRLAMQLQSEIYIPRVKKWLENGHELTTFPHDIAYQTALYGYDKELLVGNTVDLSIDFKRNIYLDENVIHLVLPLAPYGLGEYYLIFETPDDRLWIQQTFEHFVLYGSVVVLLLALIGFGLSRLLLRPMNDAIALLDDFIKDTTHELNTPVSAILTNLESLDTTDLDDATRKKLNRISIASRTISTLYDDLTYLILNHNLAISNTPLNLSELVHERLEYFRHRIEQKKIDLHTEITPDIIRTFDSTKATRLIDNLLSNAIKYNRIGGKITVILDTKGLCIEDNGIGIPADMVEGVFERYTRADKSVGGFGIGLHIVAMIAKEYNLDISIESEEKVGTKICVGWK
jgi:two-component system OmpR family sensor kinase